MAGTLKTSQFNSATVANPTDEVPLLQGGQLKRVQVKVLTGNPDVGWQATGESWSFSSWNATLHLGVATVPSDATVKYVVGMWVRFSQATGGTKWGKIVSVTTTTITFQMPNGTSLANEAITSPVYSPLYRPVGAPSDSTFEYSFTNGGSAGGTFYWRRDVNGEIFLYGSTNGIGTLNFAVSLPSGLFTAIRAIAADATGGYANTNVVTGHIESHSTTQVLVSNITIVGSNPSNPVSLKVWGV